MRGELATEVQEAGLRGEQATTPREEIFSGARKVRSDVI